MAWGMSTKLELSAKVEETSSWSYKRGQRGIPKVLLSLTCLKVLRHEPLWDLESLYCEIVRYIKRQNMHIVHSNCVSVKFGMA